jgi:hypothetical protein
MVSKGKKTGSSSAASAAGTDAQTDRRGLRSAAAPPDPEPKDTEEPEPDRQPRSKKARLAADAAKRGNKKDANKKDREPATLCSDLRDSQIDNMMKRSQFVTARDMKDGTTFAHCMSLLFFRDKAWSTWAKTYLPRFSTTGTTETGDVDKLLKSTCFPAYNRGKLTTIERVIMDCHKKYQARANLVVKSLFEVGAAYEQDTAREGWATLLPKDQVPAIPFLERLLPHIWKPPAGIHDDIFFGPNGLRDKDDATGVFNTIYTSKEAIKDVVSALLAETEGGIFALDEAEQVKILIFILYTCIHAGDAESVIGAWLANPLPQLKDLVSFHNIGFVGFLMGMHLSKPEVVKKPQWWNGATREPSYVHLNAIKNAVRSVKDADPELMKRLSASMATALEWAKLDAEDTDDAQDEGEDGDEDDEVIE